MRGVALAVVCAVTVAACGEADDPPRPAAAGTPAPAAAPPSAAAPASARPPASAAPPASATPRASAAPPASSSSSSGVLRGTYKRLNGEPVDLARYSGRVVLVVNTATECGYTPQFEGLEALYRARRGEGFVVLGFPANDFAGQEPRSDKDIATFCKANYGVSFPMFAKTRVVGDGANRLFRALAAAEGEPEWNFNKYLLDRRGRVVARYGAGTEPDAAELKGRIAKLLAS